MIVSNWPEEKLEGCTRFFYFGSRRLKWWKSVMGPILLSLLDSLLGELYLSREPVLSFFNTKKEVIANTHKFLGPIFGSIFLDMNSSAD